MTIQEQIDILTAYRDGKKIEWLSYGNSWLTICNQQYKFDFVNFKYRIKPKQKKRLYLGGENKSGLIMSIAWWDQEKYNDKNFVKAKVDENNNIYIEAEE